MEEIASKDWEDGSHRSLVWKVDFQYDSVCLGLIACREKIAS